MAAIYAEIRGFVLAQRDCAGARHADLDPFTPDGYLVSLTCGCGVEFKRWAAAKDADEDLLRSAQEPEGAASRGRPVPFRRMPGVSQRAR